eukprot:c5146_g1_i2 orf=857-1345(+)
MIRRVIGSTFSSAGIALGSEMSGGIFNVYVDDMVIQNARRGINVKTSEGRGGYIRDIFISNLRMVSARVAIAFTGSYGDHPDNKYNRLALPEVDRIIIQNVTGQNISMAGEVEGISGAPFANIRLSNIHLNVTSPLERAWKCSYVRGTSNNVFPPPCAQLHN